MILSFKDAIMLLILVSLLVLAVVHMVRHARYADLLFGDLTENVQL